MKLPFRGGRKESPIESTSPLPPKDESDPYASIVGYYALGNRPISGIDGQKGVRDELGEQFKDPDVVSKLISRIEEARAVREQRPSV